MACPACLGEPRHAVGTRNGFALFACDACTLIYVDPLPAAADLDAFYAHHRKTAQYTAKLASKIRRARRRIKRLRRLTPGRRFLDVGCNAGFAVAAAQALGYQATGIDIDAAAVGQARAVFPAARFLVTGAQSLATSGERFDVVYCSEVIEHLRDPRAFAAALASLLDPGGVLFLTTPDMGHWSLPRDRLGWDNVRPPEHLLYFNRRALIALLETCGFGDVRCELNLKPTLKVLARTPGG